MTRLHQLGWYHEISLEAGLASTYQWFLENQDRFRGNDVFTSGRLCHGSALHPLVSLDFIVENSRGEFLLGKRTNRPAQGYWFVPGGRVQKDETLEAAFERLTMAELGLRLPITAGQFYGVWQHFYDDNFSGTDFTTHYVVLGFRFRVAEEDLILPDEQHDDYRWLTPDALLASNDVHANSRAYFLAEKRAGVPGL